MARTENGWGTDDADAQEDFTEEAATNLLPDRLPPPAPLAYGTPAAEGMGEALPRERGTSLADLAGRIAAGGRIMRVVVVELASTGEYTPYLRCSWEPEGGFRPLTTRRNAAARSWSDFRTMRRALVEHGYTDPVLVYPEGHPRLVRLGIGPAE